MNKRQPRHCRGSHALGEGLAEKGMASFAAPIIAKITHFRESLCRRLCPDLLFNSDMSRELDYWLDAYESACIEIETLQKRIKELEGAP